MPIPEHPHWAVFISRSWNEAPANSHSAVAWHFSQCWALPRVITVILQCHKDTGHMEAVGHSLSEGLPAPSSHSQFAPGVQLEAELVQSALAYTFLFYESSMRRAQRCPTGPAPANISMPRVPAVLGSLCWTGLADAVLQPRLRCSALCMEVPEICISSLWISTILLNTLFSELLIASDLCLHLFITACKVCSEFGLWFCVCSS